MRTTFVMGPPPIVEDWLERRRALGQDRFDEVWKGEYHVAPAPSGAHARVDHQLATILRPRAVQAGLDGATACNIGTPTDYRVPDQAYFRAGGLDVWNPTATIVVEVASPGDDSRRKSDFYFRSGVEEVLIVDPEARTAEWFARGPVGFRPAAGSRLLGITSAELAEAIGWPGS